ncbi:uncharacterized protein LOC134258594 [Saccostrea cucullata]|uniref:uncharacterized protein LOC134258594 n=1 Tax=Saccostrea cuccullata TaxID=36930 RepID=UPI002ED45738
MNSWKSFFFKFLQIHGMASSNHKRKIIVIFITFLCNMLQSVNLDSINKCDVSFPTISVVSYCPVSEEEWNERAVKKQCHNIPQNCSENLLFHCLVNVFRNATVEVCAKAIEIVGGCAEFNQEIGSIQTNVVFNCISCKERIYNSTDAYKYGECNQVVKQPNNAGKPLLFWGDRGDKVLHITVETDEKTTGNFPAITSTTVLLTFMCLVLTVLLVMIVILMISKFRGIKGKR